MNLSQSQPKFATRTVAEDLIMKCDVQRPCRETCIGSACFDFQDFLSYLPLKITPMMSPIYVQGNNIMRQSKFVLKSFDLSCLTSILLSNPK